MDAINALAPQLQMGIAPAIIAAGISLGTKLLGGLFGKKSRDKKEESQRQAYIEALKLQQAQSERSRLARLGFGQSVLGNLKGNHAINLDPELMAKLAVERKDDFSKTVPKAGAGGTYGFLSGLFGGAADTVPYMMAPQGKTTVDREVGTAAPGVSGGGTGALSIEDLLRLIKGGGDSYSVDREVGE